MNSRVLGIPERIGTVSFLAVGSNTHLEFLDAGAGVIGEALGVGDLNVLTIQHPGQVVPYLSVERRQRMGGLAGTGRAGSERPSWEAAPHSTDITRGFAVYKLGGSVGPWDL